MIFPDKFLEKILEKGQYIFTFIFISFWKLQLNGPSFEQSVTSFLKRVHGVKFG